jgi:hypothetical protein
MITTPLPTHYETLDAWHAQAHKLFGNDSNLWRFICPVCSHITTVADWKAAGASEGEVAFSCVGRRIPGSKAAFEDEGDGPCTYAGGGFFALNPVTVMNDGKPHKVFQFAPLLTT